MSSIYKGDNMLKDIAARPLLKVSVMAFFCVLIFSPIFAADRIDPKELEDTDFFDLNATIMELHIYSGYLIVAEKKIELMDFVEGGHRFQTMVMNANGAKISIKSLKKGQRVFVRGYGLGKDRLAAREIYKLPQKGNLRSYGFYDNVPEWEHVN